MSSLTHWASENIDASGNYKGEDLKKFGFGFGIGDPIETNELQSVFLSWEFAQANKQRSSEMG